MDRRRSSNDPNYVRPLISSNGRNLSRLFLYAEKKKDQPDQKKHANSMIQKSGFMQNIINKV